MESQKLEQASPQIIASSGNQNSSSTSEDASCRDTDSTFSISTVSSWARNLKLSKLSSQKDSQSGNVEKSTFSRLTTGLSFRLSPKSSQPEENVADDTSINAQPGVLGSLTRRLVDTSKNAIKAVQVKARHIVSQNKRRYQGGYIRRDLYRLLKDEKDVRFLSGSLRENGTVEASRGMHSSKFCLNIAGDTPSSNRLFDAIASHCVPVIISDEIELPFEDVFDYDFCIFVRISDAIRRKAF